jgi:hypothetical protein
MATQRYMPAHVKAKIAAHHIKKRSRKKKQPDQGKLCYPKVPSEFEIQAFLYTELRELGYDARGEVRATTGRSKLDIVIFTDGKPTSIIEVKKRKINGNSRKRRDAQQLLAREIQRDKYCGYNLPIQDICGMDAAVAFIETMLALAPDPFRVNKIAKDMAKAQCVTC